MELVFHSGDVNSTGDPVKLAGQAAVTVLEGKISKNLTDCVTEDERCLALLVPDWITAVFFGSSWIHTLTW